MSESSNQRQASDLLETQERRFFVLEARKAGLTYRQIVEQAIDRFGLETLPQGWDERYAYKDVARELEKLQNLNNGLSEDVRQLELERLDRMWFAVYPQIRNGHLGAIDRGLRIMARRASLLGLDAPSKQQIGGPDGEALVIQLVGIDPDAGDDEG